VNLPDLRNFTAIDFETATGRRSSACAIGIVRVENGAIVDEWATLIQPPGNEYWGMNIGIHGIRPERTASSPSFAQLWSEFSRRFAGQLLVAHNVAFDRSVLWRTAEHYGLDAKSLVPRDRWFCTMRHYRALGYQPAKLNCCCERHGIELVHHDALSDARGCARLALLASGN
jgi:DNA polymerase-3 subunit epsilon